MFKSIISKMTSRSKDPKSVVEDCLRDLNESIPKMNEEIVLLKQKSLKSRHALSVNEGEYTRLLLKKETCEASDTVRIESIEKKINSLKSEIKSLKESSRISAADYGKALDARNEFIRVIRQRMENANNMINDLQDSQWQARCNSVLKRLDQVSNSEKNNLINLDDNPVRQLNNLVNELKMPFRETIEDIIDFSNKILQDVESHPEHVNRCRMFMNYYLDSTINILNGYLELKKLSVTSQNIEDSLKKTEKLLVSVKNAFESLLIKFAEDEILNLETELSVLEKTLRYEGL